MERTTRMKKNFVSHFVCIGRLGVNGWLKNFVFCTEGIYGRSHSTNVSKNGLNEILSQCLKKDPISPKLCTSKNKTFKTLIFGPSLHLVMSFCHINHRISGNEAIQSKSFNAKRISLKRNTNFRKLKKLVTMGGLSCL